MPDCCAAANCKQSTDQANVSFFRFPLDPERCKQWVGNCRRPDLQTKTPEYLHRNFKLCSKHFEVSMIHRESELKCVLKDGAVPTIFDFTTNKDNAQNSSRKRARPPAAGHPVEAKKAKDDPQATVVRQILSEDPADNSAMQDPAQEDLDKEDPATSKAKETLKVYFKETLAFTGFSIGNNAAISATKSMGSGPVGQLGVNPVCAEKIESKEVLKLGEDVMCEEIRNSLRMARFFSILLQDKTNIEGKDQIPVFVRSVTSDGFPQKHLMGFLPCDVDSDCLFLMLVSEIRGRWGLRMEHCRGFTYLTTGSLCQKLKELSCRILRDFPQVVLAPSDPYAFNLWLIRSLPVLSIQDVVDTVEEVAALLRQSSTLTKKLHAKITVAYSHIKGEVDRVKDACQNNWEYGTDAFQTMLDILEPLLNSIGEMCTSALSDVDTAIVEQLLKLKEKLKNFNFIMTLVVLKNTLCCVSILNPSLRGIISISSTLQYTISNALKLLSKHLQEIPIFHRKWFSDAVGRAKKLGVAVTLPADTATNGDAEAKPPPSPEDYYRDTLSKMTLQYLIDEVKRVLGTEMVRILRWLSLVPSYMADHNFSIRKDKVADANLNNLARPDSFYDELGCWEVKWRHASKRRILPTTVFATLKIPDIGFYPNVQSLLRVLGSIPCINADADVYGQYDMVLDRYHSYMREVPAEMRLCNMAFVYVNQDVHFSIEDMVQSYVDSHPDILQLLHKVSMLCVGRVYSLTQRTKLITDQYSYFETCEEYGSIFSVCVNYTFTNNCLLNHLY
uniref:THAP-type domain-containing protein n=1 Tax=Electrophorus electricus TaxID=8005 RepID=A0A4W4H1X1_ELEEL